MARSLPGGLAALISNPYQQPSVQIIIQDTVNRFAQLSSGAGAGQTDAIVTAAGTLLRAVLGQGTDPNSVYVDRITSPGTASQWTTGRITVASAAARAASGVAIAQDSNNKLWLFYYKHASNLVAYRTSTDDGQTWSAETLFASQPAALNQCHALCAAANGTTVYLWQACSNLDTSADVLYRATYNGTSWGSWSNEGPGSPAYVQVRGLSVVKVGSSYYFTGGVSLAQARGFSSATWSWNGTTYSSMTAVHAVDNPNLGLSAQWASISYDPVGLLWYTCVNLVDSGSVSGAAQSRGYVYSSSDALNWNLQTLFASAFSYGFQTQVISGKIYAFDGAASYWTLAQPNGLDVSDDLVSLVIAEKPKLEAAAHLVLSNLNGQYNNSADIRENARVMVYVGYGGTNVQTHLLVIDGYSYQVSAEMNQVVLVLRDATKLLDYASTRQIQYANQTVSSLITTLAGLGGLQVATLPGTSQFSQTVPCLVLAQGETWLSALHRVSEIFGFDFWSDQNPKLRVWERGPGDPSTWTYGSEILAISYGKSADQANVIRVIGVDSSGNPVFQDTTDSANLLSAGKERYLQSVERLIDTSAKCGIKGAILLHDEQAGATSCALVVALNPTHELDDVITVSDSAIGLASTLVRIQEISWHIDPSAQTFEMHLQCEGP